jgi:ribose 5-phosphate isomerase B
MMKIGIGTDHAGYHYKEEIKRFLENMGHEVQDFGTDSEESTDYPLFIRPVAEAVARGDCERGIVLGGSGNGEAMVANRFKGIRCALCWNQETALLSRKHNNANMISLGARMISLGVALEIVNTWLETPFEAGRHLRRINQIDQDAFQPDVAGEPSRDVSKPGTEKYDVLISFGYILYSEGSNTIELKVDPGLKKPTVVNIPSPETWNRVFPEWAHDRRDEILDRIKPKCGHLKCEWKEY